MNTTLQDRPWLQTPGAVLDMPRGMLGPGEGALLYYLCRDVYSGTGEIIDAGAFLGASAFCMAKGLDENSRIIHKSGRLHSYDLFRVWQEEGESVEYMSDQLKQHFGVSVADDESTFHVYFANLGALARHVRIYAGDIMTKRWSGRPIELLFVDIAKTLPIWKHLLTHFFPSLVPGVSIVVHQDYHHPLLPWIHVVQEHLAPFFEVVESHIDDSAAFRLVERIPDRILDKVSCYDFTLNEEVAMFDAAIERLGTDCGHVALAKAVMLGRHGLYSDATKILDDVRSQIPASTDAKLGFSAFLAQKVVTREEARNVVPPIGFEERHYLDANPDVAQAVRTGLFESGHHHWLFSGRDEGRSFMAR